MIMMDRRLVSLAAVIALAWLPGGVHGEPVAAADAATTRRALAVLKAPRPSPEKLTAAVGELIAAGPEAAAGLAAHVDRDVRRLAAVAESRPKTAQFDDEIATLRETLRKLREDPELSKEQLERAGLPALEALQSAWSRRDAALASWRTKQATARGQVERLAAVVQAWQAAGGDAAEAAARVAAVQGQLGPDDPAAERVAAENAALAAGLAADVVPAMNAVNAMRIACGLAPLVFDAKLCTAAATHSRDMESQGFFAHESPLPGKKTFGDRAALAGTTASGENIFMGSTAGADAVRAWFLSPGHHKNMFGADHARQGLGRSGKHWTQLFGR